VCPGKYTGFHIDRTYLSKVFDCEHILSIWLPLGDISPALGGFVMAQRGDVADRLVQSCKDLDLDTDGTHSGWLNIEKEELEQVDWRTTNYSMGDVVLFGPDMLHCTAVNTLPSLRLSCDVRFQKKASSSSSKKLKRDH